MANLNISINKLKFKNPVLAASGTFGYGIEYSDFIDLSQIGGFFVKGTTVNQMEGNNYPRIIETSSGMLNSVGLQNKGVDHFINNIYPKIKNIRTNIMVNISGSTIKEYIICAEKINELEKIPAIELNISCPNMKYGGIDFGSNCYSASKVVNAVRKVYHKLLIVKLSPNVTDITKIAKAVEEKGADAISLINTLIGMAINIEDKKPILSTVTGGLSGPCIKPIALRMVWQTYKAVKIPIIGLGGISNFKDAIEFILAGATAIQVGTYNFIDPTISLKIINGINEYLDKKNLKSVKELVGKLIF
ncbi:MAG: dihydroorotate dehydrogenase [Bacteroidales bacterium OttesenSCG-928-I14]|jgi:dihydroorotate dehydrogenase (NAD+) catalytic subunit|nr:dihydroorotate dehydrogenase [Bacteroidales bacterium OttesenSCG-928-I14]